MQNRVHLPEFQFAHDSGIYRRAAIFEGNFSNEIRNIRAAIITNCIAHNDGEIYIR
jgi:hypothetical protein